MSDFKPFDDAFPWYSANRAQGKYTSDDMPLFEAVSSLYRTLLQNKDLSNVILIACQHLLDPQLKMFEELILVGIKPSNIIILPKAYSANTEVVDELEKMGCYVHRTAMSHDLNQPFDSFHSKMCKQVLRITLMRFQTADQVILLDDGGMLISTFAQSIIFRTRFWKKVLAVEQTASGKNKLLNMQLPFLVTNVAGSPEKLILETPFISRLNGKRIDSYLQPFGGISLNILILGQGPIGIDMLRDLSERGYFCDTHDPRHKQGQVQWQKYDVIIGATGQQSVSPRTLKKLKPGCHLISVSSSDREFPSALIRSGQFQNLHLVNNGYPITFQNNRIEVDPIGIDVTIAKLYEGVASHCLRQFTVNSSVNECYISQSWQHYISWNVCWVVLINFLLPCLHFSSGLTYWEMSQSERDAERHVLTGIYGIIFLIPTLRSIRLFIQEPRILMNPNN